MITRILLLAALGHAPTASAQPMLSEVLHDPLTSEHHDEFVEIQNAGTDTVDLTNWRIGDGDELDAIVDAGQGTRLAPGEFALIVDGSYEGASTTYDSVRESARIVTIDDRAFGRSGWANSAVESVLLVHMRGDTTDQLTYDPADGRPGHSWERRRSDLSWHLSFVSGGTPGRVNSENEVAAERGRIDLRLIPDPFVDRLQITCRLPKAPGLLAVAVYDAEGQRVARLRHWSDAGLLETVTWDGRDDDGRLSPPGLYVVSVRSSAGGRIAQATAVVSKQ